MSSNILISRRRRRILPSPLSLFTFGEQGAWYDPSDMSTLFQDSAGTTPVTAVGQVVGLMVDKSGRGNHALQAGADTLKPVLQQDSGGRSFLAFDGSDDFMVTSTIDFTGTNKMSVFAGVEKGADAALSVVLELSPTIASNNGAVALYAPSVPANTDYTFGSKGTTVANRSRNGYASPHKAVLTGTADIAAPSVNLRVNGTTASATTTSQGTGNYGNHALFLGRRNGTAAPFNGCIYGLVVRGAASTPAEIAQIETWMNARTAAY